MKTDVITAVIPVSVIKSHPDTAILTETVESIRYWHPTAEIILTFDGVRPEQESRRAEYEEFIRRALELARDKWRNVCPFIFERHLHQVGMLRAVLDEIRTPLFLYVEQDTPLVTDCPIDWEAIQRFILDGNSNLVRFHHEAAIHPEHMHLMIGPPWPGPHGTGTVAPTYQWSQRPHVASVAYYRRILDAHFTAGARSFIEDRMYGVLEAARHRDGLQGWQQHRLHLYHPGRLGEENIKRSYHTDGRAGEAKYVDEQVF